MASIYCFTNRINGKQYIGSTISDPQHRFNQHLYNVNHANEKSSYPLYAAIRKYGIDNFSFEVLLSIDCSENEIRQIEHDYIVKYNTVVPNGYNQTDNTEHPLMTAEIIAKVSETKRNNAKCVGMFTEDETTLIKKFRSVMDCSEETNLDPKKISACCRGERHQVEGYCFHWLDENDEPIYQKPTGYKGATGTTQIQSRSKQVARIDPKTGEVLQIYSTIALAARETGCDSSCISKVCRGLRNQTKGYYWAYVNDEN